MNLDELSLKLSQDLMNRSEVSAVRKSKGNINTSHTDIGNAMWNSRMSLENVKHNIQKRNRANPAQQENNRNAAFEVESDPVSYEMIKTVADTYGKNKENNAKSISDISDKGNSAHDIRQEPQISAQDSVPEKKKKAPNFAKLVQAVSGGDPKQLAGGVANIGLLASAKKWKRKAQDKTKLLEKLEKGSVEGATTELPQTIYLDLVAEMIPVLEKMAETYVAEVGEKHMLTQKTIERLNALKELLDSNPNLKAKYQVPGGVGGLFAGNLKKRVARKSSVMDDDWRFGKTPDTRRSSKIMDTATMDSDSPVLARERRQSGKVSPGSTTFHLRRSSITTGEGGSSKPRVIVVDPRISHYEEEDEEDEGHDISLHHSPQTHVQIPTRDGVTAFDQTLPTQAILEETPDIAQVETAPKTVDSGEEPTMISKSAQIKKAAELVVPKQEGNQEEHHETIEQAKISNEVKAKTQEETPVAHTPKPPSTVKGAHPPGSSVLPKKSGPSPRARKVSDTGK